MAAKFNGIHAATITPFNKHGHIDLEDFATHLDFLAQEGCHGVLLSGTTGEGPSLSIEERQMLLANASANKQGLTLLAGTGTANLPDTIELTRAAYDLGMDAVVVIPPFFYSDVDERGIHHYFKSIIDSAVPGDGKLFLYNNPRMCGFSLSLELITRLRDEYPDQIIGIKDSSYDFDYTCQLLKTLDNFKILVGDDTALPEALTLGGSGAITGLSNLFGKTLRQIYDHESGELDSVEIAEQLTSIREVFAGIPRIAGIKTVLKAWHIISTADVRLPLTGLTEDFEHLVFERLPQNV